MTADLEVRDLTVEYGGGGYVVRALDGLSMTAASGELVLLVGPSGSGKTTLLSCLAGILTPTAGEISVFDSRVDTLQGDALATYRRGGVGIVFQAFNLIPSLTAVENVAAPMLIAGVSRREAKRRASELLGRVGLGDRMQHRPGDLSGGQQQRVAIARALAHDPAPPSRRADRAPRLHPGREGARDPARAGRARPPRRGVDARSEDHPDRRPGRGPCSVAGRSHAPARAVPARGRGGPLRAGLTRRADLRGGDGRDRDRPGLGGRAGGTAGRRRRGEALRRARAALGHPPHGHGTRAQRLGGDGIHRPRLPGPGCRGSRLAKLFASLGDDE